MLIYIDPGHGGTNRGTVNGGLIEKDVTLAIAVELIQSLSFTRLARFRLTRDHDQDLSLSNRGWLARHADFVLSIHVNYNPDLRAHGLTCYHWPGNLAGRVVSRAIMGGAPAALWTRGSPIEAIDNPKDPTDDWMRASRAVLGAFRATAVLAEVGFSSNTKDREFLLSPVGQASVVSSLRLGICRFLELSERSDP